MRNPVCFPKYTISIFWKRIIKEVCCDKNIKHTDILPNKNIEITVTYNENSENSEITADRNELRRVILNLCGNALNHTKNGGKIEITVSNKENDLILNVKDNGIGIPSNDLSKLFKRFSQGTSQKRSAGTGLGLYLSRQIIEAHNGKIWAESKVSEGSVFSFMIPDSLKIAEKI